MRYPSYGLLFIGVVPIRIDLSSIFPVDRVERVVVEIFLPVPLLFRLLHQTVRERLRHQLDEVPAPLARPPPPLHRLPDEAEEEEDGVLRCNAIDT